MSNSANPKTYLCLALLILIECGPTCFISENHRGGLHKRVDNAVEPEAAGLQTLCGERR